MNIQLHTCEKCRRSYWTAMQFASHNCAKPAYKKVRRPKKMEPETKTAGIVAQKWPESWRAQAETNTELARQWGDEQGDARSVAREWLDNHPGVLDD